MCFFRSHFPDASGCWNIYHHLAPIWPHFVAKDASSLWSRHRSWSGGHFDSCTELSCQRMKLGAFSVGIHGLVMQIISNIFWLVVWNMNFIFHILGIVIPTDELIFCRGVGQPPSSIYITHLILLVMAISRRHFFSKFEGAIRCYPGPRMTPRQYRSWRHWPHVEQLPTAADTMAEAFFWRRHRKCHDTSIHVKDMRTSKNINMLGFNFHHQWWM